MPIGGGGKDSADPGEDGRGWVPATSRLEGRPETAHGNPFRLSPIRFPQPSISSDIFKFRTKQAIHDRSALSRRGGVASPNHMTPPGPLLWRGFFVDAYRADR